MPGINISADALGYTSTSPVHEPGQLAECNGRLYRYVWNVNPTTITQYYPAYWMNASWQGGYWYITSSAGAASVKAIAGIAATGIGAAEYGWICVGGLFTARVGGAVATADIGKPLMGGNEALTIVTATTDIQCGYFCTYTAGAGASVVFLDLC